MQESENYEFWKEEYLEGRWLFEVHEAEKKMKQMHDGEVCRQDLNFLFRFFILRSTGHDT